MLYAEKIVSVTNGHVDLANVAKSEYFIRLKDFDEATAVADEMNSYPENSEKHFLPVDRGEWVSPRYDVIEAPKVGDEVSYAFNGDYYPCGKISKITANYRFVFTDDGHKFNRKRLTSRWVMNTGTWTLVHGHINKLNESF